MRVAAELRLEPPRDYPAKPARLALIADDGDEISHIPLKDLANAMASFIKIEVVNDFGT